MRYVEGYAGTLISGIIAVLFAGLGLPLAMGKIPPNRWYGYRVSRYQFEDDGIWYTINKKGGLHLVYAGVGCFAFTIITALFIGDKKAQSVSLIVLGFLLIILMVYEIAWSVRSAKSMARDRGLLDEHKPDGSRQAD